MGSKTSSAKRLSDAIDGVARKVNSKNREKHLSAAERKKIPDSKFAGPNRTFPVEDKAHARAAIMLSRYAPDPAAVKAKARAVLAK